MSLGTKMCEIGQNIIMKKGARLDNNKVKDWTINLECKKGASLGTKIGQDWAKHYHEKRCEIGQ